MACVNADSEFKIVWNGLEVSVQQDSITNVRADAVAISCGPGLAFSVGVGRTVARAAGDAFRESVRELKQTDGYHSPSEGDALVFESGLIQTGCIIGVCSPNHGSIRRAYTNAILTADQRNSTSLCLSAFGTGNLHVSPRYSACNALDVIEELVQASKLQHLKVIKFVDISENVVSEFAKEWRRRAKNNPGIVMTIDGNAVDPDDTDDGTEKSRVLLDPFVISVIPLATKNAAQDVPSSSCIEQQDNDVCTVCLDHLFHDTNKDPAVKLINCSHAFHRNCLQRAFDSLQAQCPCCKMWYGAPRGNQPLYATMSVETRPSILPGFPHSNGHFKITYDIPSGIQTEDHPRPGHYYHGTRRIAFLPNCEEGRKVLELFKLAFNNRLMFTVGDSVTTGYNNVVVWNGIHQKTSRNGGPQRFGYPDDTYLDRVREELTAVGITEQLLNKSKNTESNCI